MTDSWRGQTLVFQIMRRAATNLHYNEELQFDPALEY